MLSSSVVDMWCLRMYVLWPMTCCVIVSVLPTRQRPAISLVRRLFQRSSIRLRFPDGDIWNYKCICVYGYYACKTTIYHQNDLHFWSLINVNNEWLPFDATFGYFTGKLPISYVFCSYFNINTSKEGSDNVIIKDKIVHGNILINDLFV